MPKPILQTVNAADKLNAGRAKINYNFAVLNDYAETIEVALATLSQSIKKTVTQSSHGFIVGDFIRLDTVSGNYVRSDAGERYNATDIFINSSVDGMVTDVLSTSIFELTYSGYVQLDSGNFVYYPDSTSTNIPVVPGNIYFLSGTNPGRMTDSRFEYKFERALFLAITTSSGIILPQNHKNLIKSQNPLVALSFSDDSPAYFVAPEAMTLVLYASSGDGSVVYETSMDGLAWTLVPVGSVDSQGRRLIQLSRNQIMRVTTSGITTFRALTFERVV